MRSTYKKPLALLLSCGVELYTVRQPHLCVKQQLTARNRHTERTSGADGQPLPNAVTPSNAPAPVTPSSTAAAIATFSNAVENQEPVVSVDYISGTKEFTDIFEALDWIVPGVTFTLLRDTTITRR